MGGWKIYDGSLKVGFFGKEENEREEKIGGIKMKVRPTIFYPPNIGRKSGGEFFCQSNQEQITLLSI